MKEFTLPDEINYVHLVDNNMGYIKTNNPKLQVMFFCSILEEFAYSYGICAEELEVHMHFNILPVSSWNQMMKAIESNQPWNSPVIVETRIPLDIEAVSAFGINQINPVDKTHPFYDKGSLMRIYNPTNFSKVRVVNTLKVDTSLYYSILYCLIHGEIIPELKQWRVNSSDFVKISLFFLGFGLSEYKLNIAYIKPVSYMKILHKFLIGEIDENQLELLNSELIGE